MWEPMLDECGGVWVSICVSGQDEVGKSRKAEVGMGVGGGERDEW